MQVVVVINLTHSGQSLEKGSEHGLEARKAAFAEMEKVCTSLKNELILLPFEKLDFGKDKSRWTNFTMPT
ncbi:hypothetical protein LSH36_440g02048 [Paralvinella palmiformis]|uniref:Uncharacterized protein n=1 Tax=Paralvinella palmiformis TaxID=53620 RepID=A0AAD9JBV2_9ANNE|nr:hypothetical protein LSH36_440g02048 [Paralvinella palmiformis]